VTISTKTRLSRSIGRSKNKTVFLRKDFDALGTQSRVTRALAELIAEGKLIRIGYGVYAKTRLSSISSETVPALSLSELAEQALEMLGANPRPGAAWQRYNAGETTQIPMGVTFSVSKRINRKLSFGNQKVRYEQNLSSAR
jgi:tagatose-1,6-bisphosphate aldolase non-catalytic subunit AgaZ/GatZ